LIAPASETDTVLDQFFDLLRLRDKEIRNEFERIIYRVGGHPVSWYSIARSLKNINAEILWVHDEDDMTTPVEGAYKVKSANYKNVHFLITRGLGHRRIYRDGSVLKTVVEFI
jgi:pimeloyl-ACP methyl ester carboxylesterase